MWLLKELEVSGIRENLVTVDVFLYDRKFRVREAKNVIEIVYNFQSSGH